MTEENLPNGWKGGGGEGSRPLSEGGYYSHWYSRELSGSNQHTQRLLECQIDTAGNSKDNGPTEHVIRLEKVRVNDETIVEETIAIESIGVIEPDREVSQIGAEQEAHQRAIELFEEHP